MRAHLPPRYRLEIRRDALAKLRGGLSEAKLSRLMGIDVSQMSRVLLGKSEPGGRFIAQILGALGRETFLEIFDVVRVDERDTEGAA